MTFTESEPLRLQVVRSGRKTLSMSVQQDGSVLIRAPYRSPESEIRRFAEGHRDWIAKQQAKVRERARAREEIRPMSREELEELAELAERWIPERAGMFARRMGVSFGRITIRNQKTKWGSCTSTGNLNFNCLLMLAPESVRDYVIVHELSHRKQMNHSPAFWAEVERILPDYRASRQWLKDHGQELMLRNPHAG